MSKKRYGNNDNIAKFQKDYRPTNMVTLNYIEYSRAVWKMQLLRRLSIIVKSDTLFDFRNDDNVENVQCFASNLFTLITRLQKKFMSELILQCSEYSLK